MGCMRVRLQVMANWRTRLLHWMRSKPAPVLWPDGATACPRCGRPIAGALAPGGKSGFMVVPSIGQMMTKAEFINLCPIDGAFARTHPPRAIQIDDLRRRAAALSIELRSAGDPGWAKYFEHACDEHDEQRFLSLLGHSLAVLVRHGPLQDLAVARDDLEQLLVDTVATWPPKA
jgi:hypothetical protein